MLFSRGKKVDKLVSLLGEREKKGRLPEVISQHLILFKDEMRLFGGKKNTTKVLSERILVIKYSKPPLYLISQVKTLDYLI